MRDTCCIFKISIVWNYREVHLLVRDYKVNFAAQRSFHRLSNVVCLPNSFKIDFWHGRVGTAKSLNSTEYLASGAFPASLNHSI